MRRLLGLSTVVVMLFSAIAAHAETCTDSEGNSVKARFEQLPNGDYKIGGVAKIKRESFKIVDVSSDGGGSADVKLKSLRTGLVITLVCGSDVEN